MKHAQHSFALLAGAFILVLTFGGCSESPPNVGGTVTVEELGLTEACSGLQFKAIVTQNPGPEEVRTTGTVSVEGGLLQLGTFGPANSLNPEKRMKIVLIPATVVGECGPFAAGKRWTFSGTPSKVAEGEYAVRFADFSNE